MNAELATEREKLTMRSDLAKVVTERPRAGLRIKSPKGYSRNLQRFSDEDHPKREKIRQKWKTYHNDAKVFTDLLGPLYGYLKKQVGRPWNKVYSEIAKKLPRKSLQGIHIQDHIFQFVELNVVMIDGKPHHKTQPRYSEITEIYSVSGEKYPDLYVNPDNGLLCKAKVKKIVRKNNQRLPGIKLYPGVQLHKIKDVWYEVKVKQYAFTFSTVLPPMEDKVLECYHQNLMEMKTIYGGYYVGESKRPLTKKEI